MGSGFNLKPGVEVGEGASGLWRRPRANEKDKTNDNLEIGGQVEAQGGTPLCSGLTILSFRFATHP